MTKIKKEKTLDESDGFILNEYPHVDYNGDFPIVLEIPKDKLHLLKLYDYVELGVVYRSGVAIMCVELLNKHK